MVSFITLTLLQILIAWFGGTAILRQIPWISYPKLIATILVFSLIVWMVGVIASEVMKGVSKPSGDNLATVIITSIVFAILPLIPIFHPYLPILTDNFRFFNPGYFPLTGALVGYQLSK